MATASAPHASWTRWTCLLLGTLALCFSNGTTAQVAAAWAAPLLLLRFATTTQPRIGLAALSLAGALATYVTMHGVIPVAQAEFVVTCMISGALGALPYLAHRLAAPSLRALTGSLVFPAAATALLYSLSRVSPFGTWGVDGYVQTACLPLMQVASVTGVWGVTFLVFWFASAAQGLFSPRQPSGRLAFGVYGAVVVLVLALGAWRSGSAPASPSPVVAAALSTPAGLPDKFFEGCSRRDDQECRAAGARMRIDALFEHSAAAARAGAALVVWPEAAAQYDAGLEAEFVYRAQAFAREHGVYLVAGAARIPADPKAPMENKAMVFEPTGSLAFEYHKAIPVPGEPIVAGDGAIQTVQTPFGRLGVIICFDADFPTRVRQAKHRGVDVLAIPANDWRAITPLHGQMARFRAIENGLSVVRATSNGLSLVADPAGAVLAESNSFLTPGGMATARLSAASRTTVYALVGDVFVAGCALFLVWPLLIGPIRRLIVRIGGGRRQAR